MNLAARNVGPSLYVLFSVLTTATQIRPEASSIGVAEVGLLASLSLCVLTQIILRLFTLRTATLLFVGLLSSLVVFCFLGAISAEGLGISNSKSLRDAVAMLGAVGGALFISSSGANRSDFQSLLATYVLCAILPLTALLILDLMGINILGIDPWYQGERFQGWSTNPNQIGLLVTPCLAAVCWLAAQSKVAWKILAWACVGLLTVAIGALSRSDALILAWLASFLAGLGYLLARHRSYIYGSFGRLPIHFKILVMLAAFSVSLVAMNAVESRVLAVLEEGDQAGIRVTLWQHCIDAWSLSPWVGLGPGPHSGYISSLEEVEAHNTTLDLLSAGGIFGMLVFLVFWLFVLVYALSANEPWLFVILLAMFIFSQFHFVARHPVFWLCIQACVVLTQFARQGFDSLSAHPFSSPNRILQTK